MSEDLDYAILFTANNTTDTIAAFIDSVAELYENGDGDNTAHPSEALRLVAAEIRRADWSKVPSLLLDIEGRTQ